jgi:hypothetical protein
MSRLLGAADHPVDGLDVSAFAGAITAPLSSRYGGSELMRWLRALASLVLAAAILALGLTAAFGADVEGRGVDPLRVFSSGSAVAVRADGVGRLSVSSLVPGQQRTSTIRLHSVSPEPAALSLSAQVSERVATGRAPLSSVLRLRVASAAGTVFYDGSLAGLRHVPLGSIGANANRALHLTVSMERGAGNEVEGSTLTTSFIWSAG